MMRILVCLARSVAASLAVSAFVLCLGAPSVRAERLSDYHGGWVAASVPGEKGQDGTVRYDRCRHFDERRVFAPGDTVLTAFADRRTSDPDRPYGKLVRFTLSYDWSESTAAWRESALDTPDLPHVVFHTGWEILDLPDPKPVPVEVVFHNPLWGDLYAFLYPGKTYYDVHGNRDAVSLAELLFIRINDPWFRQNGDCVYVFKVEATKQIVTLTVHTVPSEIDHRMEVSTIVIPYEQWLAEGHVQDRINREETGTRHKVRIE